MKIQHLYHITVADLRNQEEYKTMNVDKCKICRRTGKKLFLKGARCYTPKCAMVKRPFPPGPAPKRMTRKTDYGREFMEKQKIKAWYNLRENQFKNYVMKVLNNVSNLKVKTEDALIRLLECRLDIVVLKAGFATSVRQAKIVVGHGHMTVNGKKVDIPSYQVRLKDVIAVSATAQKRTYFQKLKPELKKHKPASWIKLDADNVSAELISYPTAEEVALPVQMSSIFEHYSK